MDWNLDFELWAYPAGAGHMLPTKSGRIINISSVEGKQGKPVFTRTSRPNTPSTG